MLNTTTRELTAVRAGAVTVTAEADSMRDGDDLAPITGSKTIVVAPYVAPPVEGGVGGTVPATLSLTLGAPPTFGAFQAGCGAHLHGVDRRDRHVHRGRRDADGVRVGHLSNGAFQLAQPLLVPGPEDVERARSRTTRSRSTSSSRSRRTTPCAPAPTAGR